jgi:Cd2+/Zn2+-exporting ATPase/Cu+-exporting ATPase
MPPGEEGHENQPGLSSASSPSEGSRTHFLEHGHSHAHGHEPDQDHEHEHPLGWIQIARILFVGLAAAAVWFELWEPLPTVSLIGLAATLIGGYPIFKQAILDVLHRRMTMELSMTIALVAALVIGEFFTVLVIVFFVLVAEVLEGLTVGRGRRAIKDLLDLLPQIVHVRREGSVGEISSSQVRVGDMVMVKPGARIPVDGVVVQGHSFVDQATITGESLPVEKVPGTAVYAGTINQSGVLEVRTTGLGKDTAFGKIIEAVERAEQSRAPIQKTADRLAGYLVYFALVCAGFTFLITRDARSTISVIIVAGACGIAAGTPLAVLGAIGRAARYGAIIKGGIHLEVLWGVDTVVLDKTGTLTFGNPEVVGVRPAEGVSEEELLITAATAERPSEHPVGKAILKQAQARGLRLADPESFDYTPGKGIRCSLDGQEIFVGSRNLLKDRQIPIQDIGGNPVEASEVLVARNGKYLGAIQVADTLRPEAVEAVRLMRQMKLRTILLTGDAGSIAESVRKQLGVDEVGADLLPEAKLERVKALLAEGRKVAMVGDGINDAPALMQANVGIAMGSGTDVARESASILLLGNDLIKLTETLRVARWCRRIIMTNFAGTLIVDGIGVGLAAFGLLNPMIAAFIHVSSELAFILNSARLLPRTPRDVGVRRGV